jgi:hypothetical protein
MRKLYKSEIELLESKGINGKRILVADKKEEWVEWDGKKYPPAEINKTPPNKDEWKKDTDIFLDTDKALTFLLALSYRYDGDWNGDYVCDLGAARGLIRLGRFDGLFIGHDEKDDEFYWSYEKSEDYGLDIGNLPSIVRKATKQHVADHAGYMARMAVRHFLGRWLYDLERETNRIIEEKIDEANEDLARKLEEAKLPMAQIWSLYAWNEDDSHFFNCANCEKMVCTDDLANCPYAEKDDYALAEILIEEAREKALENTHKKLKREGWMVE